MNDLLFLATLVLLASAAAIIGTVVFFVWAIQSFGRRAYRQATRRHLVVPVEARVPRVQYHQNCATLYVAYVFRGAEIVNRFLTTHDAARLAEQSKQVAQQVDLDYPKDVVVVPTFEVQAAADSRRLGSGLPLGARSLLGYALHLLACLLLGGGTALALVWMQQEALDSLVVVVFAVFFLSTYVVGLLLAYPRFKARNGNHPNQAEEENRNGSPSIT